MFSIFAAELRVSPTTNPAMHPILEAISFDQLRANTTTYNTTTENITILFSAIPAPVATASAPATGRASGVPANVMSDTGEICVKSRDVLEPQCPALDMEFATLLIRYCVSCNCVW